MGVTPGYPCRVGLAGNRVRERGEDRSWARLGRHRREARLRASRSSGSRAGNKKRRKAKESRLKKK
jgi:hypothetical protein